jgi:hypothetical protein
MGQLVDLTAGLPHVPAALGGLFPPLPLDPYPWPAVQPPQQQPQQQSQPQQQPQQQQQQHPMFALGAGVRASTPILNSLTLPGAAVQQQQQQHCSTASPMGGTGGGLAMPGFLHPPPQVPAGAGAIAAIQPPRTAGPTGSRGNRFSYVNPATQQQAALTTPQPQQQFQQQQQYQPQQQQFQQQQQQ